MKFSPNFTFVWPCIVTNFFIIKPTRCTNFTNLFWHETWKCFGQFLCPSSGVHTLYTQQWHLSYRFVDSFRAGPEWNSSWSCPKAVTNLYDIHHCRVYSEWTPDDGQRNCQKHVEFHDKINLTLVHIVSFIIKKFALFDTPVKFG